MAVIEIAKIQVRRGQEQQTGIPQLDPGEFGWAQDTENLYIGKSLAEGATDDNNTRVLTEKDLDNIFALIGSAYSTATINTVYRYRGTDLQYTTTSTLQRKLDSLDPSLTDFGIVASTTTYVSIDVYLQNAINDLFVNIIPEVREERRRTLTIPAGRFELTNTVTLPPYTRIVGAGSGLTKIRYSNSASTMMKTVNVAGETFEDGMTDLTTGSSRDVVIEGMTFEFSSSLTTATILLSLDNVNNAIVRDCVFQTEFDAESTSTYGFVSHGIGVHIRGQGDNGTEKCRNVNLENCIFNGLKTGVLMTGTVVTPSIRYSRFENLNQGIVMKSTDALQGPVNGYIAYNRFQDILLEGIYVGSNPNNKNSSHLSTQNYFARVGNNFMNEWSTGTNVTSPIGFYASGNKTVDDYFQRKAYVDELTDFTGFYYNPYVRGTGAINDSAVYTKTISAGAPSSSGSATIVTRVPLNGSTQLVNLTYQLYSSNQARAGKISATINSTGDVSLTDTYNFTETLIEDTTFITALTATSGINLLALDAATNTRFAPLVTSFGNKDYFLSSNNYPGSVAQITQVESSGTFYLITTNSDSPTFDFGLGGTYTLLTTLSVDVVTTYDNSNRNDKNFIGFVCVNPNTTTNFTMEYQIDIQI